MLVVAKDTVVMSLSVCCNHKLITVQTDSTDNYIKVRK